MQQRVHTAAIAPGPRADGAERVFRISAVNRAIARNAAHIRHDFAAIELGDENPLLREQVANRQIVHDGIALVAIHQRGAWLIRIGTVHRHREAKGTGARARVDAEGFDAARAGTVQRFHFHKFRLRRHGAILQFHRRGDQFLPAAPPILARAHRRAILEHEGIRQLAQFAVFCHLQLFELRHFILLLLMRKIPYFDAAVRVLATELIHAATLSASITSQPSDTGAVRA